MPVIARTRDPGGFLSAANSAADLGSLIGQNGVGNANMPAGVQTVPSQAIVMVAP